MGALVLGLLVILRLRRQAHSALGACAGLARSDIRMHGTYERRLRVGAVTMGGVVVSTLRCRRRQIRASVRERRRWARQRALDRPWIRRMAGWIFSQDRATTHARCEQKRDRK